MKVALPFYDDSTLIFASKLKALLKNSEAECLTHYIMNGRHSGVSDRQMALYLPEGPDFSLDARKSISKEFYSDYAAALFCRVPAEFMPILKDSSYMRKRSRPIFIAFQPGLEFTPEKGFKNRRLFDVVFLNTQDDVDLVKKKQRRGQYISWGHPYFIYPENYKKDNGGAIYFFSQAISPNTIMARLHILEVLRALAITNPDRRVVIKLRHLPEENPNHVHQELFDYPSLLADMGSVPQNLQCSACSMNEALRDASIAITCTSTAAMDAISAGIPTMIYLDYIENYKDRMVEPMFELFRESGMVTPLRNILHLKTGKPNAHWLETRFRSMDFVQELIDLFKTNRQLS